ncbi:amidohydrolase family protein [Rhabdothermincola sp.]|uniref:amidohydrolase family protein n=1 Tax=Rhabdothermincola sp. TaxID=2820405 RepID=UPI002FDF84E8
MRADEMILVSVDDHVVEPPGLFDGRMPAKYADRAPRVRRKRSGVDVWTFEGQDIANLAINAVAGRPREEYGIDPTSFEQIRPGCYDVHERIKDMNAAGILGSMCFPSFPGFAGRLFANVDDKDFALATLQAYNDWHIEDWCGAYPGRFMPLALPALWSAEETAKEVYRVAEKGCFAMTFPENPAVLGYPSLHTDYWDPFWQACSDTGTVPCMHIGSSSQLVVTSDDAPVDVMITLQPLNLVQCATDLVWSGIFLRFPQLRVALSEGGIGWIPYFLERIDRTYDRHRAWTGQDLKGKLPSELFREHVITCFIDDPVGVKLRDQIGLDMITWECDYPHSDTAWPDAAEALEAELAGLSDEEIDKITHLNAMRLFSYDPFSVRPREQCTVGALKAEAGDHDVSIKPSGQTMSHGAVTAAAVQAKATA